MVDGVHADTLHLGEDLLQPGILVEQQTSLEDGLVVSASSGDDSDGGAAATEDGLTGARWESETGLKAIIGVTDDGGICSAGAGEGTLVTGFGFDVADGCSFGDLADGQDIADSNSRLLATEDVLAGVGALGSQEVLGLVSVFVRIAEFNLGKGSSTSGIMDNALDDTPNVAVPFGVVESAVVGSSHSPRLVGLEDTLGLTLSLA